MCVLSGCGHAVHEDVPDKVSCGLIVLLLSHFFSSFVTHTGSRSCCWFLSKIQVHWSQRLD